MWTRHSQSRDICVLSLSLQPIYDFRKMANIKLLYGRVYQQVSKALVQANIPTWMGIAWWTLMLAFLIPHIEGGMSRYKMQYTLMCNLYKTTGGFLGDTVLRWGIFFTSKSSWNGHFGPPKRGSTGSSQLNPRMGVRGVEKSPVRFLHTHPSHARLTHTRLFRKVKLTPNHSNSVLVGAWML